MQPHDIEYFAGRARQERDAAARAVNARAASLHAELAERYDAVAKAYAALDRTRMRQA